MGGGGLPDFETEGGAAGSAFRALFESAPIPITAITLDGRIFAVNPRAQEVLGFPPSDNLLVEDVAGPELLLQWREDSTKLASGERKLFTREVSLTRADGKPIETRSTIIAVGGPTGAPAFLLAVVEPLDEQVEVKQRVQWTRAVVHDVANQLMVVAYGAEALLRLLGPADPARPKAEEVHDAAERAVALARASLSQTETKSAEAKLVDVNGLILGLRSDAARLLGAGIDIVLVPDLEAPFARTDPVGLQRAVINIASNAHDAMLDGGTFTIQTERLGDSVVIRLSDSGVGIPPELQEAIFTPDFTTKSGGHGVGLASVRDFVVKWGGSVSVESELGRGSTFTLTLPAA